VGAPKDRLSVTGVPLRRVEKIALVPVRKLLSSSPRGPRCRDTILIAADGAPVAVACGDDLPQLCAVGRRKFVRELPALVPHEDRPIDQRLDHLHFFIRWRLPPRGR